MHLFVFAWGDFTGGNGGGNEGPKITLSGPTTLEEPHGSQNVYTYTLSIDECPTVAPITLTYHFDGILQSTQYSAKENRDFRSTPRNHSITFDNNPSCTKSKTFTLKVLDDFDVESDETMGVSLNTSTTNNPNQPFSVSPSILEVTIKDTDTHKADMQVIKTIYSGSSLVHSVSRNQGDIVHYRLDVNNGGPAPKAKAILTDTLPEGLSFIRVEENIDDFSCHFAASTRTITCDGDHEFTRHFRPIHVFAKVDTNISTILVNRAHIEPIDHEEHSYHNNDSSAQVRANIHDHFTYSARKTADRYNVTRGETVRFTLAFSRTHGNFDQNLSIDDILNQAFEYQGNLQVTPAGKLTCNFNTAARKLECNSTENINTNTTYKVSFDAKVIKTSTLDNTCHYNFFANRGDFYLLHNGIRFYHTHDEVAIISNHDANNSSVTVYHAPSDKSYDYGKEVTVLTNLNPYNSNYFHTPFNDHLSINVTGLPNGITYSPIHGTYYIHGTPTQLGDFNVTVTATDCSGSSASFSFLIHVSSALHAKDNIYQEPDANQTLTGNVITDLDSQYGKDTGVNTLKILSHTDPSYGSLTLNDDGSFTYTPTNYPLSADDSFEYTITDDTNLTSTARVIIKTSRLTNGGITNGHAFYLVNPPQTRNIIGDFVLTGNTLMCVTNKTGESNEIDSYNGTCQTNQDSNNNNYMVRYIDIDNDNTTWNSSTGSFSLPQNHRKIAWAGLFWQGSLNNHHEQYKQRRAEPSTNGTYTYIDINTSSTIDLPRSGAKKIKLKIDNRSYVDVDVDHDSNNTFFYDERLGNAGADGGYYAAFADVTAILQDANLSDGIHTATVANLLTNEGRETQVGLFGGWSLVVIYLDDLSKDAHNVSIFNGYTAITYANQEEQLTVSGFRLPKAPSNVDSHFAAFVGEGEYYYGKDNTITDDLYIAKNASSTKYSVDNSGNVFDAKFSNITRPSVGDNAVTNTNGVDLDTYDISDKMKDFRDNDANISSVVLGLSSKPSAGHTEIDYVTPSMIAFSTQLFKPKLCYDYTLSLDGFIINSTNNRVETPFGNRGVPLTTNISVRSEESDFTLHDVNISYRINNTTQMSYVSDSAQLAFNDTNNYINAASHNLLFNDNSSGFGLYIGKNAQSGLGGEINAYETEYIKFDNDLRTNDINTSFDLRMKYIVSYGSGDLELAQIFNRDSLCTSQNGYYSSAGRFNIASFEADDHSGQPYNLYTQIASRPFKVKLFSYTSDFTTLKAIDNSVEVDLINADILKRDTNITCQNPETLPSYTPKFYDFNGSPVITISDISYPRAMHNIAFRMWYLKDINNTIVEHNCTSQTDQSCFVDIYQTRYSGDTSCSTECSNSSPNSCYQCLKTYYGVPVCSRDNFSIRPEAFKIAIIDSNESTSATAPKTILTQNTDSTPRANLVAGYEYRFDINASNYLDDNATPGYHQYFNKFINGNYAKIAWNPSSGISNCNDTNDQNISILLFDGTTVSSFGTLTDNIKQIGEYQFKLLDSNWTYVDQNASHHTQSGFVRSFDCTANDDTVDTANSGNKQGCNISSIHSGNKTYKAVDIELYPYTFYMSSLVKGAGPTNNDNNSGFVYVNNLNSSRYPATGDENMSYNIQGTFTAKGYHNETLSNFVTGCYAADLNLSLNYKFLTENNLDAFTYDLYNTDPVTGNITSSRISSHHPTQSNTIVQNISTTATVTESKSNFAQDANGSVTIDLGFNFDRNASKPVNPRRLALKDFNISYASTPNNLSIKQASLTKIQGTLPIDKNVSFYYAKVKPKQDFYDDINATSVNTPISVAIYCDLGFVLCQQAGIDTNLAKTDEFDWWISLNHNNDNTVPRKDGNIVLTENVPTAQITPAGIVNIRNLGTNTAVAVTRDNNATLPLLVPVNLQQYPPAVTGTVNYTDRWLIYNPGNINPLPPLFKVRFIGNGTWSGVGKTGNVVGDTINTKKSYRMER